MRIARQYFYLLIFLFFVFIYPFFVRGNYGLNIGIFALQNVIIVTGLTLLLGYAGQISLGHAGFVGLGAYLSAVLVARMGINCWLAMAISAAIVGIVAYLVAIPTLKLKGHYLAMATLGLGIILYIFFKQMVNITGGPSGFVGIPFLKIGKFVLSSYLDIYIATGIITLLELFLSINLTMFSAGRSMRALHNSEAAAMASGINTMAWKIKVFVYSAVLASIAGSLYAHTVTFISPSSFGFNKSILLIVMVMVGGMESIWGGVIGAIFLTYLPEFLRSFEDYDILIYGILLILVIIFLPSGIVGGMEKVYEKFSVRSKGSK